MISRRQLMKSLLAIPALGGVAAAANETSNQFTLERSDDFTLSIQLRDKDGNRCCSAPFSWPWWEVRCSETNALLACGEAEYGDDPFTYSAHIARRWLLPPGVESRQVAICVHAEIEGEGIVNHVNLYTVHQ